jgi:hypothetical protein
MAFNSDTTSYVVRLGNCEMVYVGNTSSVAAFIEIWANQSAA